MVLRVSDALVDSPEFMCRQKKDFRRFALDLHTSPTDFLIFPQILTNFHRFSQSSRDFPQGSTECRRIPRSPPKSMSRNGTSHLGTPAHRNAVEIRFPICVPCVGSNASFIPKKVADTSSKTSREVSREVCREVVGDVSVKLLPRAKKKLHWNFPDNFPTDSAPKLP